MARHSTVRARCREIPSRSHDVFAKSLKFPRESLSVSVFLALAEATQESFLLRVILRSQNAGEMLALGVGWPSRSNWLRSGAGRQALAPSVVRPTSFPYSAAKCLPCCHLPLFHSER